MNITITSFAEGKQNVERKKTVIEISVLICLMLLIGGGILFIRLFDGRDLESRARLAEHACREPVTLYSEIVLNPDSPGPSENRILVDELLAENGRFGYAVYVRKGKNTYHLETAKLYDSGVLHESFSYGSKTYHIFQCSEPELQRLVVCVTNSETGERTEEEFALDGGHIFVTELPEYPSGTITGTFYDIHGNTFE